MTYLITTKTVDGSMDGYRAVTANLPAEPPPGMLARYVGPAEGGLGITVVWESKAHADRFTAEHLMPAIRTAFGDDTVPPEIIAYEVEHEVVPARS
jgi:hypothetical protein